MHFIWFVFRVLIIVMCEIATEFTLKCVLHNWCLSGGGAIDLFIQIFSMPIYLQIISNIFQHRKMSLIKAEECCNWGSVDWNFVTKLFDDRRFGCLNILTAPGLPLLCFSLLPARDKALDHCFPTMSSTWKRAGDWISALTLLYDNLQVFRL